MIKIMAWASDAMNLQTQNFSLKQISRHSVISMKKKKELERSCLPLSKTLKRMCAQRDSSNAQRHSGIQLGLEFSKNMHKVERTHNPGPKYGLTLGRQNAVRLLEDWLQQRSLFRLCSEEEMRGRSGQGCWWKVWGIPDKRKMKPKMNGEMRATGCAESVQGQENYIPGNGVNFK